MIMVVITITATIIALIIINTFKNRLNDKSVHCDWSNLRQIGHRNWPVWL